MVSSTTLLSDTILFTRDTLRSNITDPLGSRPAGEKFVMTSYPRRNTTYPIITVKGMNLTARKLGQQSETMLVSFDIEVRTWARNEKEKNNLWDEVFTHLRTNQFPSATAGTSTNADLHDFRLDSSNDIDEPGEEGIKSKIDIYKYIFITN